MSKRFTKLFFIALMALGVFSNIAMSKEAPMDVMTQPQPALSPKEIQLQEMEEEFEELVFPFDVMGAEKEFIDRDANGKSEALAVTLTLASQASDGPYTIEAILSGDGYSQQQDLCDLKDHVCSVRFEFPNDRFIIDDLLDLYEVSINVMALEGTEAHDFAKKAMIELGHRDDVGELEQNGVFFVWNEEAFAFTLREEDMPELEPIGMLLGKADDVEQQGIDDDRDGKFETLRVIVPVLSRTPGLAELSIQLYGNFNPDVELIDQQFSCALEPGRNQCLVDLDTMTLSLNDASGPYTIYVSLDNQDSSSHSFLETSIPGFSVDHYVKPDVMLKDKYFSEQAEDQDMNGLYDGLVIHARVQVKRPGDYIFNGNLADASGNYIGFFSQKQPLKGVGEEYVSLSIPGKELKNAQAPYRFYDCLFYFDEGRDTPENLFAQTTCEYHTNHYRSEDFE